LFQKLSVNVQNKITSVLIISCTFELTIGTDTKYGSLLRIKLIASTS